MQRRLIALLVPLLLAACAGSMAGREGPVSVGVIAFNDFHGALEPPQGLARGLGGSAYLASAIEGIRSRHAHSVTVSAGDLTGASQFASSLHLDEPTVGAMNRIGLDFNAVGNHEFDRGQAELVRLQRGGCARHAQRAPCRVERFGGARFRYLAANVTRSNGQALFPASAIRRFGTGRQQVRLGVIGLTLKATPTLVSPGGVSGLAFGDEAEAINREVARLTRRKADAIMVLIHQGGRTGNAADPDGCEGLSGEILPILARIDPRVDLVVSGHTHQAYVCNLATGDPARPLLLTSAGLYGTLATDITLEIDPRLRRVVAKRARQVVVDHKALAPDPAVAAYVQRYVDAAGAEARRPAGRLAGPTSGIALGNLAADAQLAATQAAGAEIALLNPFGLRAPLLPAADGTLTFGDLFKTMPFDNRLVTMGLSGAQLKAVLEQGFDATGPEQALAPSAGFTYRFDRTRPAGERIVELSLNGQPIEPARTYRVTINSFLAGGGDTFTGFIEGHNPVEGASDVAALEAWLAPAPPRLAPAEARAAEVTSK